MSILDWLIRILTLGRGAVSLVGCVLFSVFLLTLNRQGKQTFHDVMVSTFLYPAQIALSTVNRSVEVFSEHESLKTENARLRVESDMLRQRLDAQPRLLSLDEWSDSTVWQLKKALVIAEQPSRLATTWVINLGTADSIGTNMPVITSHGVVGKVVKCFTSHSLVQLITDPNFRVSVIVERSRARGILEFWKVNRLAARFPVGSDVKDGDTLVTSGLGGVFPKGLLMGRVEGPPEEDPDQGDIMTMAHVVPGENPNLVEEVFVLIHEASYQIGEGG
jgi:rod shape-determining protein MreC